MRVRGAVLLALAVVACARSRITREEEEARLTRLLPNGTPALRVAVVLDSLHIDHSAYDPAAHRMNAIDRHTAHTTLIDTSIRIDLRFDSQGRLISRTVKEVYTGP